MAPSTPSVYGPYARPRSFVVKGINLQANSTYNDWCLEAVWLDN
jgi:hypothetical protein